jgi:hypothetical protein
MGAVALGLEVEEQTLGEMFLVFDYGDERAGHCLFDSRGMTAGSSLRSE